jgi:hypothetical protein
MKLEALQVCAVATAKGTVELQIRKQKGANSEWQEGGSGQQGLSDTYCVVYGQG